MTAETTPRIDSARPGLAPLRKTAAKAVPIRLILVEEGAQALEPPAPLSDDSPEVALLVQSRGEAKGDFVARALRRIAALERSDRVVTEGVIAAAPFDDEALRATRMLCGRALLAHMARSGEEGEIVLVAHGSGRPELRHELLELAGQLSSEGSGMVGVRVLFQRREPEAKSGVHALLSQSSDDDAAGQVLAAG